MELSFRRSEMQETAQTLASGGVFVGTSSWKYAGWCGMLYDPQRYLWKGRLAESRFQRDCLEEYASVFKTVCVDAAYYRFPDAAFLERLRAQVPRDFRFSFKVTDEITVKRFTNLPRFAQRAGQLNPNFLNAELFIASFLQPCEALREQAGVLMFEFSKFHPTDFERGRQFMEALDRFLAQLPPGWRYAVEIRNRTFLQPEYFAMLARHQVAHVYNNWTGMPSVAEQMTLPGSQTSNRFAAARFLLKPGRTYQEALDQFGPYDRLKEIDEASRIAGAALIRHALRSSGREEAYIYVNNRLEGNALSTIQGMVDHWRANSL